MNRLRHPNVILQRTRVFRHIPTPPGVTRRFFALIVLCSVGIVFLHIIRIYHIPVKTRSAKTFSWKPVKVKEVDCSQIIAGNQTEIARAKALPKSRGVMTDGNVTKLANQCAKLKREKSFITSSLSEEEEDFPLAFSLLVYKEADQVLNLLAAIYRPQNFYCIHVDQKSKPDFHSAMTAVVNCFPNVFLSSRSVTVRWGRFTVLEPELICMQDLWNRSSTWKYFINLTGQEFPLKTNHELVKILKAYNGANDAVNQKRLWRHASRWHGRGAPPHNIKIRKGSVHVAFNRHTIDFILHSQVAEDFLGWVNLTGVPDETYFASINYNPHLGIKGTYNGSLEETSNMIRYKNWGGLPCKGEKFVRGICMLSIGDLSFLEGRPELFANKFLVGYSRFASECLAERLFNRTRREYLGQLDINVEMYRNLSHVKYAIR